MSPIVWRAFGDAIGSAVLTSGAVVDIRLASPCDLDRVRTFFMELSDESTHNRFFSIRTELPDDELRDVVTGPLPHHVTLLAELDGQLIGVGEYVPTADPDDVEVAFAVADAHHREGVATLLLERLATIAHQCGIKTLTAVTLPGNSDMQLVFRTVGLPEQHRFEIADGVVHIRMDLTGIESMLEQMRIRDGSAISAGSIQ